MATPLKRLMLGTLFTLAATISAAQTSPDIQGCMGKTKTQADLNDCSKQDAGAAERALNSTYQAVMKKYADEPKFIERLREAQRAWLRFRDAQIAMRFPAASAQDAKAEYGSVYPMCYGAYKAELTRQRTRELQLWLRGITEGGVCSGSVKRPEVLK